MRYFYLFLCYCLFVTPTFAVYDLVSIDIAPSSEGTKFCFYLDTDEQEMYLAFKAKNNPEFLFFDEELALFPIDTPPIFLVKKTRPSCFGPFSDEVLQNIELYAGAGANFDDVVSNQKYLKIFDGFPTLTSDEKQWTIMVYLVGSTLESEIRQEKPGESGKATIKGYASKDILEMLAGTLQSNDSNINVVVSTGGSARAGWKTVKRSLIRDGQQYVLEDLGRKYMSDPQTLSDFVGWATTEFPAQHYALILWNHGGGTQGFGQDTSLSQNADMMTLSQLHDSYQTIRSDMGKPLDIVVYDACLMSTIEVAEVTATVAESMAASAETEPEEGIDYEHLLNQIAQSPPINGVDFGKVAKASYIHETKEKGTFNSKQITYSVFDLTQMSSFSETFAVFADEFNKLLKEKSFLDYERLSRGIIRAPGYPSKQSARLSSLRSTMDDNHIRVDFYNLLQTIGPNFDAFSQQASDLIEILDNMIVDYEANENVQSINAQAGRISLAINISNVDHLSALPEAYTLLNQGLVYYDERRGEDRYDLRNAFICREGMTCAFAQWLELQADEILGVETYLGQKDSGVSTIHLIDRDFYHYRELTETLELGVDGHEACQYQICVNDGQCENITLTKQNKQLLADIILNDYSAILSFCEENDSGKWATCGVSQQINGIWGRDGSLYPEDSIIPNILTVLEEETELQQGHELIVGDPNTVNLKTDCDEEKAAIWGTFYGLNQQKQMKLLCDSGDCVCKPNDTDLSCQKDGFKAGVYLMQ